MAVPPGLALFSLLTYDYKHCATILQEPVCPVWRMRRKKAELKLHLYCCATPHLAVERQPSIMQLHYMLYYRKPKACAAGLLRAALVHSVEALKVALLLVLWDAYAVVLDSENCLAT